MHRYLQFLNTSSKKADKLRCIAQFCSSTGQGPSNEPKNGNERTIGETNRIWEKQSDEERFSKFNRKDIVPSRSSHYRKGKKDVQQELNWSSSQRMDHNARLQTFQRAMEENRFESSDYLDNRELAMNEIKSKTNFKHITRYYRFLLSPSFKDREYLDLVAATTKTLRTSLESFDLSSMTMIGLIFAFNFSKLNVENQLFAREIIEMTLRLIRENQDTADYRLISYGFTVLSQIEVDDYTLYDSMLTAFEKSYTRFSDIHVSILIKKVFGLIIKLKANNKYFVQSRVLTKRLKEFMNSQTASEKFAQISERCLQQLASKKETTEESVEFIILANITTAIFRHGNLEAVRLDQPQRISNILKGGVNGQKEDCKNEAKANGDQTTSTSNRDILLEAYDAEVKIDPQEITRQIHERSWSNIKLFLMQYHSKLPNITFKQFLEALVGARVGTDDLISLMLRDFHRRLQTQSVDQIPLEFFCLCVRSFNSKTIPLAEIQKYSSSIDAYAINALGRMTPEQKLILISSYANNNNRQVIGKTMASLTYKEVNQLSLRNKILVFWSLVNVDMFDEILFKNFILDDECDPSNEYFGINIQQVMQITHILSVVRVQEKKFWESNSLFEEKFAGFSELASFCHSKHAENQGEHQFKKVGTFDMADVLNAFGLEFYNEPVIEKTFNVDFVIKGLNLKLVQQLNDRKSAVASLLFDLQNKEYIDRKKFNDEKMKVDKNKDLLLEVVGKHHFVSRSSKKQSTHSKIQALKKLGYNVISIDLFELEALAQLDRNNAVQVVLNHFHKAAMYQVEKTTARQTAIKEKRIQTGVQRKGQVDTNIV